MRLWYVNSAGLLLFLQDVKSIPVMLFFLLCFCRPATAQSNSHYMLSVFGTRNGLLSPKIYSVKQTSDRYLWIGTEIGASRYNGYEFQNIQYTIAQEQIGKIVAIAEDSSGGVWLGGEGGLFYFFNGETVRCLFVKEYVAAVESLVTDKEGNLWIGEMHGLYRLSKDEILSWRAAKKNLLLKPHKNISERVICLDADEEGNIYFGSFDGVFFLERDAASAKLIWKNTTPNNLVHFVTTLSPDSIFLNQYDGESVSLINGIEKHYNEKSAIGQRFFKKEHQIFRLTTSAIEDMRSGTFVPFIIFGQQTNFAYDALYDAEGNFWLGTWEGLFRYRYTPFTIYHRQEKDHPETFSFLENNNGELLFGGNRGRVDHKNNSDIIAYPNIKPVFPLSEVLAMYQYEDGSYWFGSGYEGVTQLHNGVYTNYNESKGLTDNHCNTFYKVDEHTVFGCTEKGVLVIDPSANQPIKAQYSFAKAYNRQPKLLGVYELSKSVFLFYSNGGLFRLRNGVLQHESIKGLQAENLYVTRIAGDNKGRIWMATQGKGLLQCVFNGDELILQHQFTKKNGLLSDELLSVLVDKNDRLWVADYTSLSLLKESGSNSQFVNFTEKDGLPGDYYQHLHLAQQSNGEVWAITSMNIFSFNPDSLRLNTVAPKLFFNTVELEDQEGKNLLSPGNNIQLDHNQNSLSFSFTAISLTNPGEIKYAYRLLPGDTSWIETHERSLHFSSLLPGKYNLEIKASNNTGVWSAPLQYSFTVKPPFWNTWWFYSLLGALFLVSVYWFYKRRIKSVKDKAALQQQLAELESKALRAQMNPHFIFNSLNAIQELIVTQNVEAAYDYLSKFSKLLRLVLNNSEKSLIPLSEEIAMLQLYLELESLRFRKSFSYEIQVEDSLDAETVLAPPLLLQPFIENAIWHGLMLKEAVKKITLNIHRQEDVILCVIEDNGIGRKRAAEIKEKKLGAVHLESKGLKLSQQRIGLLQLNGKKGNVKIEDLYENGEAAGTRVNIQLPLMQG